MRQEEVAVLIILVHLDLERFRLHAPLGANRFRLGFLLGEQGVHPQLAELQIRLHTKQRRASIDQRVAGIHAYVSGLYRLDDLVLLAGIGQLQLLGVEIERGLGIVIHVEIHLATHRGLHVQLHALVEIEEGTLTRALGQRGVVVLIGLQTHRDLGGTLRPHPHATRAEYPLGGPDVELHVGQVELLARRLLELLLVLRPEIRTERLLHGIILILGRGQAHGGTYLHIAQFRTDDVGIGFQVVLDGSLHVLRIPQVGGRLPDDILIFLGGGLRHRVARGDRILRRRYQLQLRQGGGISQKVRVQRVHPHAEQQHHPP